MESVVRTSSPLFFAYVLKCTPHPFYYADTTKKILHKGYVTSHIAPPAQNLQKGILLLQVQPGYVGRIRTREGCTDRGLLSAFPMKTGDILNLRDIEQGLEQLMRSRTQQARMEIVPSGFAGSSDIVVIRENVFPLTYGVSFDNAIKDPAGKWLASGYLVWDRPFMLNDSLMFFYNQDMGYLSHSGRRGNSLYYTLPWGNWTWGLHINQYSYLYRQLVPKSGPAFYAGSTSGWGISSERMLHRTQKSKTSLHLHLSKKNTEDSLEYINRLGIVNIYLNIGGLDVKHRHYLGRSIIDGQVRFQKG